MMKFFFMLSIIWSSSLFSGSPKSSTTRDRLDKSSAIEVYGIMGSAQVAAFSKDNLIRAGFEDKDLKGWNEIIIAAHEFIRNEAAAGKAPAEYATYAQTLEEVFTFIKNTVDALHGVYAKAYIKPAGKEFAVLDAKALPIDIKAIARLNAIGKNINYYLDHVRSFNFLTLENISLRTPIPNKWKKQLYDGDNVKDAATIFKYKDFIKSYKKTGSNFELFIQQNNIGDKASAQRRMDELDKVAFIMTEKLKTEKNAERQENLRLILEIYKKLSERFPGYISSLQMDQLYSTKDKSSVIIFAESGAFEAVLNQLKREVIDLLENLRAIEALRAKRN